MGYETSHHVNQYLPYGKLTEEMLDCLIKITGYSKHELIHGSPCKWYNEEADMINFSKLYPTIVFAVTGKGENHDDLWRAYYRNGKRQTCIAEITYPPFSPDKLK